MLRKHFDSFAVVNSAAIHIPLHLPASSYVAGIATTTLTTSTSGSLVFVSRESHRMSHGVVAMHMFYLPKRYRCDTVIMESDGLDPQYPVECFCAVWFVKALSFVRVCVEGKHEREMCFVQFL